MKSAKTKPVEEIVDIEEKKDCPNPQWRAVGVAVAASMREQGASEITIPADPQYITAFGLFLQGCYEANKTFSRTFINDSGEEVEDIEIDEEEKENKPEVDGWEYCSECEDLAVERTELISCEEEYEYYCDCGHAWWGSG